MMFVAFCWRAAATQAYTFEVDGIYYYKTSSTTVSVSYKNESSYYDNEDKETEYHVSSDYAGDIIIPDKVSYGGVTYKVTSIRAYAFANAEYYSRSRYVYCGGTDITSIKLPTSITSIGEYAFGGCSMLTTINIPKLVSSISTGAFEDCTNLSDIDFEGGLPFNAERDAFSTTAWYKSLPNGII